MVLLEFFHLVPALWRGFKPFGIFTSWPVVTKTWGVVNTIEIYFTMFFIFVIDLVTVKDLKKQRIFEKKKIFYSVRKYNFWCSLNHRCQILTQNIIHPGKLNLTICSCLGLTLRRTLNKSRLLATAAQFLSASNIIKTCSQNTLILN